jgi:hypothetical protein
MFLLSISIQVLFAWFYSHVLEYILHRVMHDYKHFPFFFKHHFGGHHKIARQNEMRDDSYINIYTKASLFEVLSLLAGVLLHLPVFFFFPYAYVTLLFCVGQYYWMHRKSHIDIEWGKKHMPWHYQHHMSKNQHKNWGVRSNMIDKIEMLVDNYIKK